MKRIDSSLKFNVILTVVGIALDIVLFLVNNIVGFIGLYIPIHWIVSWIILIPVAAFSWYLFIKKFVQSTDRAIVVKATKILLVYTLVHIIILYGIDNFIVFNMDQHGPILILLRFAVRDIVSWPIRLFTLIRGIFYSPYANILRLSGADSVYYILSLAQAFLPFALIPFSKKSDCDMNQESY